MSKFRRALLMSCRVLLWMLAFLFGIRCVVDPEYTKYGGVIAGILLPFVPIIIRKIYKVNILFRIEMLYYVFVFIALDLGICMDLYKDLSAFVFDKIVHFLSGMGTSIIGYYALSYFKTNKTPKIFRGLFIVFFSMAIAVCWEFFEFGCDKILGTHMQTLVSEGVDDTMLDLLSASVGAIFGAWLWSLPGYKRFIEG